MEHEIVGKVAEDERDEIKSLFERKNGLQELFKVLPDIQEEERNTLYEKLVSDLGIVATQFDSWWKTKSKSYNWKNIRGCRWEIDFETCEIFLLKNSTEQN